MIGAQHTVTVTSTPDRTHTLLARLSLGKHRLQAVREPRRFRLSARNRLAVVVAVVVSALICVGQNANVWQPSRTNICFKMAVMR